MQENQEQPKIVTVVELEGKLFMELKTPYLMMVIPIAISGLQQMAEELTSEFNRIMDVNDKRLKTVQGGVYEQE